MAECYSPINYIMDKELKYRYAIVLYANRNTSDDVEQCYNDLAECKANLRTDVINSTYFSDYYSRNGIVEIYDTIKEESVFQTTIKNLIN